ncbi:MAG: GAF domain-containing protein [Deltaproteobacteria bacterium]|nr:GAF domain-containing protein [Deltaproteobacteria bacterium]
MSVSLVHDMITAPLAHAADESADALLRALRAIGSDADFDVILNTIAGLVAEVTRASYCAIFLPTPDETALRLRGMTRDTPRSTRFIEHLFRELKAATDPAIAELMAGKAPIMRSASNDQAVFGEDSCRSMRIGAIALLPILVRREVAGCAIALVEEGREPFDDQRLQTAWTIVRALGATVALEHLRNELRHNIAEREAFWGMTAAALEETDLHKALELVCREALHISRAGGTAILLLDEHGSLRVAASVGDGAGWSDQILFQALSGEPSPIPAEPVLLDDLGEKLELPQAELIRSMLAVPLRTHGRTLGVLQIVNPRHHLHENRLKALVLMAGRIAVVTDHFRLNERSRHMVLFEERRRMAHELHDSVTQSIYAVSVLAEAAATLLDRNRPTEAAKALRDVRDVARMANREMRALVFELNPPDVTRLDLIDGLQARLASVESRAGIKTVFEYADTGHLPAPIQEGLYRIAQEALNNSMKHARASTVWLRLSTSDHTVRLEMEDDGVGFRLDETRTQGGAGLRVMEERAAAMNGKIAVESTIGGGTCITIEVPVEPTAERAAAAPITPTDRTNGKEERERP